MTDPLDLDAIEAAHRKSPHGDYCYQCGFDLPCESLRLVAELRTARATITDATARLAAFIEEDGMSARISFKAANAALRRAEAAEARIEAARAIHSEVVLDGGGPECAICNEPPPCRTTRALADPETG